MRRYILPVLFGFGGTAILIALALWQVQRLDWKETLIARIEARIGEAPAALPATPDPDAHAFMPVEVTGMLGGEELHVLTSARPDGPGFRVIAPLETLDGRRILVDRGYIPEAEKAEARLPGMTTVTGNLLWPDETDSFTPEPSRDRNIWFARDLAPMAEVLGTEPVLVVARAPTGDPGPRPMPVTVNLPNNHLQYAITWSLLAVLWLAMTVYLMYRIRRNTV